MVFAFLGFGLSYAKTSNRNEGITMKFVSLILICALFCLTEIFLFVILPEKTSKVILSVSFYVLSILVLYVGGIGIYNLGKFWNLESQVKIMLGISAYIVLLTSLMHTHLKQ